MQASKPDSAKSFIGGAQPRPLMENAMYVGILALLGLIGTVIGLGVIGICVGWGFCFKWPITWAVMSGVIGWIGTIIAVIGAGMVISMMSQSLVGKMVSSEETVTMASLAATPALIAGILNIIPGIGSIIVFLAFLYSAVLFYMGSTVKFGQDKAIIVTIVYIAALIVITLIFGFIAGAVYAPAMGIGPGVGYMGYY